MIYLTLFNSHDEYIEKKSLLDSLNVTYDEKHLHYNTSSPTIVTYSDGTTKEVNVDGILTTQDVSNEEMIAKGVYIVDIEIGNTVTELDTKFLSYDTGISKLTGVTFSDSLLTIGNQAFLRQSTITGEIIFTDSITSIGIYAFNECSGITKIDLSSSLTIVSESAFEGCSDLTEVTGGESLTTIGVYGFGNCPKLETIDIPSCFSNFMTNSLYNCTSLQTINYGGTSSDWEKVTRGTSWCYNAPSTAKIVCTDKTLNLSDYLV